MLILADENVARDMVAWLRSGGHDVTYAAEEDSGATDAHWASRSVQEQRLILTSDKDFGDLIFRDNLTAHGVVLLRLDELTVAESLVRLQEVWSVVEANPSGRFIVVTRNRVRVRML